MREEDGASAAARESIFGSLQRGLLVGQLQEDLNLRTMAELRAAARRWGWPLRATNKAAAVEQFLGYLQNPEVMSAATASLPRTELLLLAWLVGLGPSLDVRGRLQAAMQHGSGVQMTLTEIDGLLLDLLERCLVVNGPAGVEASQLYLEWLPPIEGEALRTAPAGPRPATTVEWIADETERLLVAIDVERPRREPAPQNAPQRGDRLGQILQPRPGLLPPATLVQWGYRTPEQQWLAAFLAELLSAMRIIEVGAGQRIAPTPDRLEKWLGSEPVAQLEMMRQAWLTHPLQYGVDNWDELDMALSRITGFEFRGHPGYILRPVIGPAVLALRQLVLSVAQTLQAGVWYSFERLCALIAALNRNPMGQRAAGLGAWTQGGNPLPNPTMSADLWRATYGQVVAATLRGPASWLGFVEVDLKGGELTGFRPLPAVPPGNLTSIPPDALRFTSPDTAVVRKTWKAARLRPILARVGREVATDARSVTYRLNPATFRASLARGDRAEAVIRELEAAGFPPPPATAALLTQWEARNGRYQLYDDLAVIELGGDVTAAEVEALIGLSGSRLYEAAPGCLLVLDRNQTPAILEELRRRGYTPGVRP